MSIVNLMASKLGTVLISRKKYNQIYRKLTTQLINLKSFLPRIRNRY